MTAFERDENVNNGLLTEAWTSRRSHDNYAQAELAGFTKAPSTYPDVRFRQSRVRKCLSQWNLFYSGYVAEFDNIP